MKGLPSKGIDTLCRRRCAFALFQEPGGEPRFCMQKNGSASAPANKPGFLLAAFDGRQRFITDERQSPPPAEGYPPLPLRRPETTATARAEYQRLFALYSSWLHGPEALGKVVLARTADLPAPPDFSPTGAFLEACKLRPGHFNALVHTDLGTWLCSTPELLLAGKGDAWQTMALAGTRPAAAAGEWDAKNMLEHSFVAQHIADCLQACATDWHASPPQSLAAGNIQHLCTRFSFRMPAQALPKLLAALPPSPAVCGFPATAAREKIAAHPDIDRSCYAGYLGPIRPGSASLYVTLRCMQLFPGLCRLYAGGGLMPDSLETSEWAETEAKMASMRTLLQAPARL